MASHGFSGNTPSSIEFAICEGECGRKPDAENEAGEEEAQTIEQKTGIEAECRKPYVLLLDLHSRECRRRMYQQSDEGQSSHHARRCGTGIAAGPDHESRQQRPKKGD